MNKQVGGRKVSVNWPKIIGGFIFLFWLTLAGGSVFAESGIYDYSGDFSKQIEQNLLDRDYKMELNVAKTTIEYSELEAKYIKLWDRELNVVYQKLMKKLNGRQADILTDSQVGWLQWHTKETQFVDAVWINDRKLGTQGAIQELKAQKYRLRSRTLELMEYYCLLGGTAEFEYQGKEQGQAEVVNFGKVDCTFLVPAGWKAQKQPQGFELTNSSVPGSILVTALNANSKSQALQEMEKGIHNQYMNLQLDGRIYSQNDNVWGAAYYGTYLGRQVSAAVYANIGSRQGPFVLVLAIQAPNVIYNNSMDISSLALQIANSTKYRQ